MRYKIHWTLWFFLIGYVLAGLFREIGLFFLFVIIHELAHISVARAYGLDVSEVVLYPFGGRAQIDDLMEEDPKKEFHIAIAGPMVNILMGMAAFMLESRGMLNSEIAWFILRANMLLALFNLLPGLPLDGGRVVRSRLCAKFGFKEATHIACQGGKLAGLLVILLGIIGLSWQYLNITFFIAGGFILVAAFREERDAAYVYFRYLTRKKQLLRKEGAAVCEQLIAFEDAQLKQVTGLFRPKRYHLVNIIDYQWRSRGTLTEEALIDGLLKYGATVTVSQLLGSK